MAGSIGQDSAKIFDGRSLARRLEDSLCSRLLRGMTSSFSDLDATCTPHMAVDVPVRAGFRNSFASSRARRTSVSVSIVSEVAQSRKRSPGTYTAVRGSQEIKSEIKPIAGSEENSAIVLRSQSPRSRDTAFSSTRSRVAAPSQSINHPPLIDPYGQRIHHSRWPVVSQSHTYTWSPQAAFRFSSSGSVGRPHGPLGVCGATVLGLADPPSSRCRRRPLEAMRARALTLT
jgi:hypothetical protein